MKSQGIIMVELQELFPESSVTSILWIFSMASVINRAEAVFVSWFMIKTSHRTACLLGSLLMVIGYMGTAFAPEIWIMYISYGTFGLGTGMVSLSSMLSTGSYFKKYKALAVGITAAGSGIGTVISPNLLRYLFDNFTFSGALLLFSGFMLHLFPLVALLRPISLFKNSAKEDRENICVNLETEPTERFSASCNIPQQRRKFSTEPLADGDMPQRFLSLPDVHSMEPNQKRSLALSYDNIIATESIVHLGEPGNKKPKNFHWRLIYNTRMIMLGISLIAFSCGTSLVYRCIAPLGESRGVKKEVVAIMLSVSGISEVVFKIGNGWVADQRVMTALDQYTVCVLIAATSAAVCAIVSGLPGMIVMLVGMSTVGTSVFSLVPIICHELFGEESTSAMGLLKAYRALSPLLTTFIAGKIYETFGWWEPVFFYMSGVMFLGSAITAPYCISQYIQRRRKSNNTDNNEMQK